MHDIAYIKPLNLELPLHEFVGQHGVPVAREILDGAPKKATLFVYAYIAKSIDYLRIDDEGNWQVFTPRNGAWRTISEAFLIQSFNDIAFGIEQLKSAVSVVKNG